MVDRALGNANCLHGEFTPYAIRAALRFFRAEVEEHVLGRRCRARVCRGLIRHRVTDPAAPALAEAARLCPSGGDRSRPGGGAEAGWVIDDPACVQCGLCLELAPEAVLVEDRFPGPAAGRAPAAPGLTAPAPATTAGA